MYRVLVPVDRDVDRVLRQVEYVANLPHASESVEALLLYVFSPDDDVDPEREPFKSSRRANGTYSPSSPTSPTRW